MMKRCWTSVMLCLCIAAAVSGCGQPQKMDMSAMKPPERPKELDQLEPWVGNWTTSGEGTWEGKPMKATGTSSITWECDRMVLVGRGEEDSEGMGKSSMLEVYTWNPKTKRFNAHYFNSMGVESHGDMTYDANTKTHHITGKGPDPMTGKTTIFEGDSKMIDSNTYEWTWAMWDGWKIKKTGEGKGTMKRK